MKKFIYCIFLIIYLLIMAPNYCIANEENNNTKVLDTAMNAMKINACAIKTGDDIICTVKDYTTAQNVIDKFYYQFAKCGNNEVLVEIAWAEKPETVNVKENIFNILNQEDAVNMLLSAAKNEADVKIAALSVAAEAKADKMPSVSYTKYVKETETEKYITIIENSETLYQDQSQIKQKGIQGIKENIYKIVYINDGEQSRELLKSEELIKAQNEIIIKGTKIRKYPEYAIPAYGFVSSSYGMRNGEMHLGIDIANSKGTEIYVSKDGVVVRTEWYYGYGKCIDIKHYDGSWTRYGHLDEFLVNVGDKVNQSEKIGLMGTTGNSTGYHLHFEIRYGKWPYGRTVDPSYFLDLSKLKN